jgi:hypothetical protein
MCVLRIPKFLYKNRTKLLSLGVLSILSRAFLEIKNREVEPEETIAGFLCGLGLGITLISVSIKNQKNLKN